MVDDVVKLLAILVVSVIPSLLIAAGLTSIFLYSTRIFSRMPALTLYNIMAVLFFLQKSYLYLIMHSTVLKVQENVVFKIKFGYTAL